MATLFLSQGFHTLNLWLRDSKIAVDKFVLTSDLTYQPLGTGPDVFDGTSDGSTNEPSNTQSNEPMRPRSVITDEVTSRNGGSVSLLMCLLLLLCHLPRLHWFTLHARPMR